MTIEQKQNWYFTFGYGMENKDKYVKIYGTFSEARKTMFEHFDSKWSFQYPEKDYEKAIAQWNYKELVL